MSDSSPHPQRGLELEAIQRHERLGRPFLTYRPPGGDLQIALLPEDAAAQTIGRRAGQLVALEWDARVSRVHARLEALADSWWIVDDGVSTNGTFVGAERVVGRRRLEHGDVLVLGGSSVAFHDPTPAGLSMTIEASGLLAPPSLSPAQRRVLDALCRPCRPGVVAAPATNQQIAAELVVGVDAVKTQMRSLFTALGVGDLPQNQKRARVVERAFELGMVRPDGTPERDGT